MASSSFTRCPIEATPSLFQGLVGQARKNRLVYVIFAECRLIFPEAQAPQPDHDVHNGAYNQWAAHIMVCLDERVQEAKVSDKSEVELSPPLPLSPSCRFCKLYCNG